MLPAGLQITERSLSRSEGVSPSHHATANVQQSEAEYDQLYKANLYGKSFPVPSPRTFRLVSDTIDSYSGPQNKAVTLIDFGAGDGRYEPPLLEKPNVNVVAYDVSAEGLKQLAKRLESPEQSGAKHVDPKRYLITNDWNKVATVPKADVVAALYGVLGLVGNKASRQDELSRIRGAMTPEGTAIIEVPNALRREINKPGRASNGKVRIWPMPRTVTMSRTFKDDSGVDQTTTLNYQLYNKSKLRRELQRNGFIVDDISASSLLAEKTISNWAQSSPRWASAEAAVSKAVPAPLGFGFIAKCRIDPNFVATRVASYKPPSSSYAVGELGQG